MNFKKAVEFPVGEIVSPVRCACCLRHSSRIYIYNEALARSHVTRDTRQTRVSSLDRNAAGESRYLSVARTAVVAVVACAGATRCPYNKLRCLTLHSFALGGCPPCKHFRAQSCDWHQSTFCAFALHFFPPLPYEAIPQPEYSVPLLKEIYFSPREEGSSSVSTQQGGEVGWRIPKRLDMWATVEFLCARRYASFV